MAVEYKKVTSLDESSYPLTGDEYLLTTLPLVKGKKSKLSSIFGTGWWDNLKSSFSCVKKVDTIAELRTIPVKTNTSIDVLGYYGKSDGFEKTYVGHTGAAPGFYIDNHYSIIVPAGSNGSSAWIYTSPIEQVSGLVSRSLIGGRKKPGIEYETIGVLKDRKSRGHRSIHPRELGYNCDTVVIGNSYDSTGNLLPGNFILAAPYDSSGTYTLTLTLSAFGSANLADVVVAKVVYYSGTGAQFYTLGVTGTAGVYSTTVSVSEPGTIVGWKIIIPTSIGAIANYSIDAFSITTASSAVYNQSNTPLFDEAPITFARSTSAKGVKYTAFDNGFAVRSFGFKSGKLPLVMYCDPTGTDDGAAGNEFQKLLRGYSPDVTSYPIQAFYNLLAFHKNGYDVPALLFSPGTYENASTTAAMIQFPNNDPLDYADDFYIGCIYGTATFNATGGAYPRAVECMPNAATHKPTLHISNISCTANILIPFRFNSVDVYAYRCSGLAATINVFETTDCNMYLQECEASGSSNDGINAHGTGHIMLIDCISDGNTDDGFSPHDECTFEVWGGEYKNNGKGNVTPAYGAQGVCVRVESTGCTGLSPRVGTNNYGGFLCYSDQRARPTKMILIDCTSENDKSGITSVGSKSITYAEGGAVETPVTYSVMSANALSDSGSESYPGIIELVNVSIDSGDEKNIEDYRKYVEYSLDVFNENEGV